jgi:Siphovirus Gp157
MPVRKPHPAAPFPLGQSPAVTPPVGAGLAGLRPEGHKTTTRKPTALISALPLYVLTDQHMAILEAIEENGGELTPELEAAFDASVSSLEGKITACCFGRQHLIRTEEALKTEIDRLQKRATSAKRAADGIKTYVKQCMDKAGLTKVKNDFFTVWTQDSPYSVRFVGPDENIPKEYQKVSVSFDGTKALDDYKAKKKLPENIEVTRGHHIVIK